MKPAQDSKSQWGSSYRLVAAEKWKAKSAAMGAAVTQALIDYASPQAGMHVLDLASGTGEPAIGLASVVGNEGHVTALDLSAELLLIAEQRARHRGLDNFSTCQADAQSLPFPDQSFDLVTCRFGVMFFADCNKALLEVRRVLRPGGRACFVAWGPFEQPYWSNTMGIVLKQVGGHAIRPGDPDPFKFAHSGSLSAALHQAGYAAIEENTETQPWIWPGGEDEVWEYQKSVAVPFRPLLDRVPPEKWDAVNREVHAALSHYREAGSVKFGAVVVLASGMRS
jgi:ubiquinone/menaquinone biosynthesis C-methylase UbiE